MVSSVIKYLDPQIKICASANHIRILVIDNYLQQKEIKIEININKT